MEYPKKKKHLSGLVTTYHLTCPTPVIEPVTALVEDQTVNHCASRRVVLIPLACVISGYIERLSSTMATTFKLNSPTDTDRDYLKALTKPFTTLIIQVSCS